MNRTCQRCGAIEETREVWPDRNYATQTECRPTIEIVQHQDISIITGVAHVAGKWASGDGSYKLQRSIVICNPCADEVFRLFDISIARTIGKE